MEDWLEILEKEADTTGLEDVVLWPGSVEADMQPKIVSMYGKSDWDDSPDTRPGQIIYCLSEMGIGSKFSVLDICCGDGLVLYRIKRVFPGAVCLGIDINKDGLSTLPILNNFGVGIYRVPMQNLFQSAPPKQIDITMMLNTYRGWGAAKLRESEYDLPEMADHWMARYSKHSILTARQNQIDALAKRHTVVVIGRGEEDSKMVLVEWHE